MSPIGCFPLRPARVGRAFCGGRGFGFGGAGFAEDVGGADDGVLDVGAGLAFEAERVFEVEGDDGVAGEAEHEVAEGADGDLLGDGLAFVGGELGVAGVDFGIARRR